MTLIRRLLYTELLKAIVFVTLVFLALFYFFDFSDEASLRRFVPSYSLGNAAIAALWQVPAHVYELLPITTLIGTIYVLSRLAQSGEFTIMRISGLSPFHMLRLTLLFGLLAAIVSFVVGDYLAPLARQQMEEYKISHGAPPDSPVGKTGTWLRDSTAEGSKRIIQVRQYDFLASLAKEVTIIEFNPEGQFSRFYQAQEAQFIPDTPRSILLLSKASILTLPTTHTQKLQQEQVETLDLNTSISADMVATSLMQPARMSTWTLYQYMQHLEANGQDASRYAIEFWRKVFYPISALVMVVLALPFAYLHARSGGIALYVFMGVMLGVSFFLLNNVAGHLGYIQQWTPWLASAAPGLIYSALSLIAFTRLVLRH